MSLTAAVLVGQVAVSSAVGQVGAPASDTPAVVIDLAKGTPREQLAKQTLERLLASHDLNKFTFSRRVVIEQGAINHAFPVLTLNPYFASSPDELLSTYIHEQLHWHLRNRASQQQAAITELRRLYPRVPVGLPASAENEYSTYGHLVTCYLEILADRELLGRERAAAVIRGKPWYTWIYATVLADEKQIAGVVDRHQLRVPVTMLQSPGEAAAADIRKSVPVGWTCTVVSEKGKMGHPHGLQEPLFRLDFVNANLTLSVDDGSGLARTVHPNLRLHFHPSSERARILKTIEAERLYSWAIPVLFADTRDYVVVTSPLWQNHYSTTAGGSNWGAGVYTEEANELIAPLLRALKAHFDSRK